MTAQQGTFDPATSRTPIYATQGGGYATFNGVQYVWHSDIPDFVDAKVGDPIPEEWSVAAINEAAHGQEDGWDNYLDEWQD